MHLARLASSAVLLSSFSIGCGGSSPAPPKVEPGPSPVATAAATGEPPPPPMVDHLAEAKAVEVLGPDGAKLLQALGKASPKTEKGLINNHLFVAINECPNLKLVDVAAAPGLLIAKPFKVRERTYKKLLMAGARAQQRGTALEVLATQVSVKDAVAEWNRAVVEAATRLVKAAPPGDQKEKSFAVEAMHAVGEENSPKTFDQTACESGRLGGAAVVVQLVTLDAAGKRGKVLVKGGADAEHFEKDGYPTLYWDKIRGKQYRTLTEIMSVGFFRVCGNPSLFSTSTIEDGTWRCKDVSGDSWDPPNRPIPSWQ